MTIRQATVGDTIRRMQTVGREVGDWYDSIQADKELTQEQKELGNQQARDFIKWSLESMISEL